VTTSVTIKKYYDNFSVSMGNDTVNVLTVYLNVVPVPSSIVKNTGMFLAIVRLQ